METAAPRGLRSRRTLLEWARVQKHGNLSPEQAAALDAVYPGWRLTRDDRWERSFEYVRAYHAAHGKYPPTFSMDRVETAHGIWLAAQRTNKGSLSPERRRQLDECLPGWNDPHAQRWQQQFDYVVSFHAEHARLPKRNGDSKEERSAGSWLIYQRKNPTLAADYEALLDRHIKDWREDGRGLPHT